MICYNFLNNRNLDLMLQDAIDRMQLTLKLSSWPHSLKTNQLWGNFENILFNIGESCFAYMTWFFMWSYITKYQWFANRQVKVGLSLHKFHCQLSVASALAFVSLWRPFVSLQLYLLRSSSVTRIFPPLPNIVAWFYNCTQTYFWIWNKRQPYKLSSRSILKYILG